MAPPTVIETPSQLRRREDSAGDELNQTVDPLGSDFGGPAITITVLRGTPPLGTSISPTTSTSTTSDSIGTPSITLSPSPAASVSAHPSTNSDGFGGVTYKALLTLAAVLSVLIVVGLGLVLYPYRRKWRRIQSIGQPQMRERQARGRTREVEMMDGCTSIMQDPFASRHWSWGPLPPLPTQAKRYTRQTMKTVRYESDAGSVYYVLDGDRSICGDNGASARGTLPPAYDEMPSRAGTSEPLISPPPTPSTAVNPASSSVHDYGYASSASEYSYVESSGHTLPTSLYPPTSGPSRHGNN